MSSDDALRRFVVGNTLAFWKREQLGLELLRDWLRQPVRQLDQVLEAIATRYGSPTADFVAMQLEYPWWSGAALKACCFRQPTLRARILERRTFS